MLNVVTLLTPGQLALLAGAVAGGGLVPTAVQHVLQEAPDPAVHGVLRPGAAGLPEPLRRILLLWVSVGLVASLAMLEH